MKHRRIIHGMTATVLVLSIAGCADDSSSDSTSSSSDSIPATADSETEPTLSTAEESTVPTDSAGTQSSDSEPDIDERADDLVDALEAGDFSTTLDLLELSGVADELEGREVTVLAPTEEAFRALSVDELADVVGDGSRAKDVIRRHILDGLYTYDELSQLTEVTTVSGETYDVSTTDGSVMIEGATVSAPSEDALAGKEGQEVAVFGIDQVLLDSE